MGIVHARDRTYPARFSEMERAYLEAGGERAALIGRRDGSFECWIWPLLVADELRVTFGSSALDARERGGRRLCARPDGFELSIPYEQSGARGEFVVEAFALRDRRALVLTATVHGELRGRAALEFRPAMRPMWPAGLGAQLCSPDEASGALALSEELGRFAVLIGAPGGAPVELVGDRGLQERVHVRSAELVAGDEPAVFVIAGAERAPTPLDDDARRGGRGSACGDIRARDAIAEARELYRETASTWLAERELAQVRWRDFLDGGAHLSTSDARLDDAFVDSRVAIERSWAAVDGLGRTLLAGIGPSHGGDRPGYAWFFNGDALVASRTLALCGDTEGARAVLRFAAGTQRADGKIAHEISLSAGSSRLCDWFGDYPYAYYKGQVTPGFVSCLAQHLRTSGDVELARELLPAARRAMEFCAGTLDEAGRMRIDVAGIAAVEAGPLAGRIESDCYLQGIYVSALEGLVELEVQVGDPDEAERAREALARARTGLATFWSDTHGRLGFAHLRDGERCDDRTAYTALPIARGQVDPERCLATTLALNEPELSTDWGVRMFAETSPVYDPAHYNTGSVFPYLTNFQQLALFRAGLPDAGYAMLASQARLVGFLGPSWCPEFLLGDRAQCPPRAVPHQVFSHTTILQGVLTGLLGLEPAVDEHGLHGDELLLTPALPAELDQLELHGLRFRDRRLDVRVERRPEGASTRLAIALELRAGPPLRVRLGSILPPLSRIDALRMNEGEVARAEGAEHVHALPSGARRVTFPARVLQAGRRVEAEVLHRSGPRIALALGELVGGAKSRGVRLVGQRIEAGELVWTFAGQRDAREVLGLAGDFEWGVDGARIEDGRLLLAFDSRREPDVARISERERDPSGGPTREALDVLEADADREGERTREWPRIVVRVRVLER